MPEAAWFCSVVCSLIPVIHEPQAWGQGRAGNRCSVLLFDTTVSNSAGKCVFIRTTEFNSHENRLILLNSLFSGFFQLLPFYPSLPLNRTTERSCHSVVCCLPLFCSVLLFVKHEVLVLFWQPFCVLALCPLDP